jgi:hypothetical protein
MEEKSDAMLNLLCLKQFLTHKAYSIFKILKTEFLY